MYEKLQQLFQNTKDIPYPEIGMIRKNRYYANLLYEDLSGELSAIAQYVYEHICLNSNQEISKILLQIAIQEMRHLNLVGEMIQKLGNKPYYQDARGEVWSAKSVKYDTGDLKKNDGI